MDDVTSGARGFALVEVLSALVVFGIGAAAVGGLALSVTTQGRQAAIEGRRAALGLGVADRVRAGLLAADSGVVRTSVDGQVYEVEFVLRDSVAVGSLESAPFARFDSLARRRLQWSVPPETG